MKKLILSFMLALIASCVIAKPKLAMKYEIQLGAKYSEKAKMINFAPGSFLDKNDAILFFSVQNLYNESVILR